MGWSGSPFSKRFLGPLWNHVPNANSIELAVFSLLTLHSSYTSLWAGPFPTSKLCLPLHLIHRYLDPHKSTYQATSWSVQPFLHESQTFPTDRQTDHATTDVAIGHIYAVHMVWPNIRYSGSLSFGTLLQSSLSETLDSLVVLIAFKKLELRNKQKLRCYI